ncbi:hypothetical protein NEOLEDRAFT_1139429 [Neolentinus lepideus HHB14362 ss-1]|uniref:F-box domain-containing protein n=1 Tax=Neolentinus lepideus HHB14362 ss-1 TaxID=1314782 RepID=A0A165PV01_9AGAM|nr:hypothetical protein NEOLEDRAFT_1139429 [Neolentinus lepideus HHB14362 ss-1]
MSSTAITTTRHRRGHSIYFTAASGPDRLSTLPSELALHILSLALSPACHALSKRLAALVDLLLYTSVSLHSRRELTLFLRKPDAFLAAHVKKLEMTCEGADEEIARIVRACAGARSIVIPATIAPFVAHPFTPAGPAPFELTLLSYINTTPKNSLSFYLPVGVTPEPIKPVKTNDAMFSALTHLRFCEPASFYASPSAAISALSPTLLGTLTHLQVARRGRANEQNDVEFTNDVRALLKERKNFECLVVTVFPSSVGAREDVRASDVWSMLEAVGREVGVGRLVVMEGVYGQWDDPAMWERAREEARRQA